MIERCERPAHIGYKYYGARGIKVCRRWRKDFAAFLADMGPKPSPRHSLDRHPDQSGDYRPGNCRWATPAEQRANQRPQNNSARVQKSWDTGKRSRISHARSDLTGKCFGRLLVLRYGETRNGRSFWLCQCSCGAKKNISGKSLRRGLTKSCGCQQFEAIKKLGQKRTSEDQRARALKGWVTRKRK